MRSSFLALLLLAGCSAADPGAVARVQGRWLAASGNIEVDIAPCGGRICGTITRVLANASMGGSGQTMGGGNDVGLQILSDFVAAGGDAFEGRILNRQNGKVYDCVLRPGGADELVVRPYVLVSLFGQTQVWHRVR